MPDKIAVVGNCQTQGVVGCLRALLPDARVDPFFQNRLTTEDLRRGALVALKSYDLIFSQNFTQARYGLLTRKVLERKFSNIIFFPQIIFRGFHPDDSHIEFKTRGSTSPLDRHHSAILAAAFSMSIPAKRAIDLFNAYIFARLGYFDEYDQAKSNLVSYGLSLGYDLSSSVDEWTSTGPFMYVPTHPALRVLSDISRLAAAKAGIAVTGSTESVPDVLMSDLTLPVYPPLAKRLGFTGSTVIKLSGDAGTGPDDELGLEEFAHRSYRAFASFPKEVFDTARVKAVRDILHEERVSA